MHMYKYKSQNLMNGKNAPAESAWRAMLAEANPLNSSLLTKCLLLVVLFMLLLLIISSLCPQFYLDEENLSDSMDGIDLIDNGTLLAEFIHFQKRFLKNYSSAEETLQRFSIFVANFRQFEEKREDSDTGMRGTEEGKVYGITTFFDWSDEELTQIIMPHGQLGTVLFPPMKSVGQFRSTNPNYKRPKEFDWRKKGVITHVKNQLRCGACWAFATAAVVESQHAIHNGTLLTLSEQQMIDCDQSNNGCEGGSRPNAFRYVRDNGLLQEKAYPFRGGDGNCELSPGPVDPTQRVFVDEVRTLPANEEQIADFIAEKGPVSFGMNVTKGMFHYVGGIFSPNVDDCAFRSMGRHALEVVGFGEDGKSGGTPFWIVKNSWGSSWGINGGYVHIRRGIDACGLSQEVHTALVTRFN